MPESTPESSLSGTPGKLRARGFNWRAAWIMMVKQTALTRNALPEPAQAAIAPASAGPAARATLKATAPSATARCRSLGGTSSLTLACCAGW